MSPFQSGAGLTQDNLTQDNPCIPRVGHLESLRIVRREDEAQILVRLAIRTGERQRTERTIMSRSEIERYRRTLEAKRRDLVFGLGSREDIVIEKAADTLDEVQFAGERELAIRNLDRESKLLKSVRSALARIEDGSYGVCLHCDTAINPKRLGAVPWAEYCVRCQEAADRREFESDTTGRLHELQATAA